MEKLHLEITECQGEIPVKAKCSACINVEFTALPRSVDKNRRLLDLMFADHCQRVHAENFAGR